MLQTELLSSATYVLAISGKAYANDTNVISIRANYNPFAFTEKLCRSFS